MDDGPPLEILEAGTGHGALTLHLARAIHAANSPCPSPKSVDVLETTSDSLPLSKVGSEDVPSTDGLSKKARSLADWKKRRRAIIHTIDAVAEHSRHAKRIVEGFSSGLYAGNVDFHSGDVGDFMSNQCRARGVSGQIFHHILLDLPGTHNYIVRAAQALRPDGTLVVFSPSVTQIAQVVEVIRKLKLPLSYDQVIELGAGYGGGKQWDVRLVRPRKDRIKTDQRLYQNNSFQTKDKLPRPDREPLGVFGFLRKLFGYGAQGAPQAPSADRTSDNKEEAIWHTICRPSVGHKVVGGGFVGVWRRKKDWESFDEEDAEVE